MAAIGVQGVRALAGGVAAFAETNDTELEYNWYREEQLYREYEKAWREEDMEYRKIEKIWRAVESKRARVSQTSEKLILLARLSAYMSYAAITIFVNQGTPEKDEEFLSQALMVAWGVLSVVAVINHMTVMIIATIVAVSLLQVSMHEGPDQEVPEELQYKLDNSNPDGLIRTVAQLECLWDARYDKWHKRLVVMFSIGIPLNLALLIPLAFVKFESPALQLLEF